MKKILVSLCLIGLFASPAFSQKDSSFLGNVIIRINPTLALTSVIQVEGEWGAVAELPIKMYHTGVPGRKIGLLLGGGYNREYEVAGSLNTPNPDGVGYTIRTGLDYYFNKKNIVSLSAFYRVWKINQVIDYGTSASPFLVDPVLDPSDILFSGVGSEESPTPAYRDNATANAGALDLIYTRQISFGGRVLFEWYAGLGIRYKSIEYERVGAYVFPTLFNIEYDPFPYSNYYAPYSEPKYYLNVSNSILDIKAGVTIAILL